MSFIRPCFDANNILALSSSGWSIDGTSVTASAAQLNAGGSVQSTSTLIPWTSWNYFVGGGGGGDYYWAPAVAQNSSGFDGPPNTDFGDVNFIAPVDGTYQFTIGMRTGNNIGIMTVTINEGSHALDGYVDGQTFVSLVWTQTLTAGTYGINISSFTKNDLSSNYWLTPLGTGLTVQLLPSI